MLVRVDLPDANPGLLIARGRDDHFRYWPDGKLKSRTDASVVTTTYASDLNRCRPDIDPPGSEDDANRLLSRTDTINGRT